jgi:hypothetical protein
MNDKLPAIIEESIKLELNVAMLYKLFSNAFPDDADFWKELFWEEKHHATIIKSMREALLPGDEFPEEVVAPSLSRLSTANNKLTSLIEKYTIRPPESMHLLLRYQQKNLLEKSTINMQWSHHPVQNM